jgi:NDP-sugar pyrophosphorylase family protein
MPVGDMPILEIILRQLRYYGFQDVTLSVGYLSTLLQAYFGDGARLGVRIRYSHEERPLGTAGPIRLVSDLTDPFVLTNGDVLHSLDYRDMVAWHGRSGALVSIGACRKLVKIDLGVLETDGSGGQLLDYVEKPLLEYRVSMGVYVCDRRIRNFVGDDERLDLPELIKRLLHEHERVSLYRFDGYWRDIGTMDDYAQATQEIESLRERLHF